MGVFALSLHSFGVISNDTLRRTSKLWIVNADNLTEIACVNINDYVSGFVFNGEGLVLYSAAGNLTFWHFDVSIGK